jgi:hypothetical protein
MYAGLSLCWGQKTIAPVVHSARRAAGQACAEHVAARSGIVDRDNLPGHVDESSRRWH